MRVDLALIAEMIAPGTRVLDIGSGDGSLIEHLFRTRGCDARGIEIDMAEVTRAVAHGLPVMLAASDAAHRHTRAGESSQFRPLGGALAPGAEWAHADD